MNNFSDANKNNYTFWKTKPVQKMNKLITKPNYIKTNEELQKRYGTQLGQIKLPEHYEWLMIEINDDLDKNNPSELGESGELGLNDVVNFLNENYKTDFVSLLSVNKIKWMTMNNGFFLCVCAKNCQDHKIISCVCLTERTMQIYDEVIKTAEAMFLCCDEKYRKNGLAKVMMCELMRIALNKNYNIGSFCTDRIVPTPIATIRYYTRSFNYKHLKANNFADVNGVDDDIVHDKMRVKLRPPKNVYLAKKTRENIEIVYKLYNDYMKTFNVHNVLTIDEVENYFFNEENVRTIFYEDENENVVDFLTYTYYDIVNTKRTITNDDKYNNVIKATRVLCYSSNHMRSDYLMTNAYKIISRDKHHILYIPDMMESYEALLTNIKKSSDDTDDEEENSILENNIVKSNRKDFINLFNYEIPKISQDMISYLIFF